MSNPTAAMEEKLLQRGPVSIDEAVAILEIANETLRIMKEEESEDLRKLA